MVGSFWTRPEGRESIALTRPSATLSRIGPSRTKMIATGRGSAARHADCCHGCPRFADSLSTLAECDYHGSFR
jgi:hypothetical protein